MQLRLTSLTCFILFVFWSVHVQYLHFHGDKTLFITGNGLGMKIVGGKTIVGITADGKPIEGVKEVGAYVSSIFPGGVADQLHGELQEGQYAFPHISYFYESREKNYIQRKLIQT